MAAPLKAGIPPDLDLTSAYVIEFAAIDPTTGAANTSVVVSAATLLVDQVSPGTASDLQVGPFMLVPGPES